MNQEALSVQEPNRNIMKLFGQGKWRCAGKSLGIYETKSFSPAAKLYSKSCEACGFWKGSQDTSQSWLSTLQSSMWNARWVSSWPDLSSNARGLQRAAGRLPVWGRSWNAVPYHLQIPPVWLPAPSLTKKHRSSEVRSATPTYTLEWLGYTEASLLAHVNVLGIPSPNSFYTAKIQIAKWNLCLLVLLFGNFISKTPFTPWLWSTPFT